MPSPELVGRLSRLRLVVFDVDGVLTDGTLVGAEQGGRRWDVRDGFGLWLAGQSGLALALCSGKDHPEIRARAEQLGIRHLRLGRRDKAAAVREILAETGVEPEDALFVGDDLFDLPAMAAVGLSATPADARPELRARADWRLEAAGGRGAAREIVEGILSARGEWEALIAPYLGDGHV